MPSISKLLRNRGCNFLFPNHGVVRVQLSGTFGFFSRVACRFLRYSMASGGTLKVLLEGSN